MKSNKDIEKEREREIRRPSFSNWGAERSLRGIVLPIFVVTLISVVVAWIVVSGINERSDAVRTSLKFALVLEKIDSKSFKVAVGNIETSLKVYEIVLNESTAINESDALILICENGEPAKLMSNYDELYKVVSWKELNVTIV